MSLNEETQHLLRPLLDPVVFLSRFVRIETPEGFEKWKLDPYQKHLLRDQNRSRIVNKSKKTGISTTIAGEAIHRAYFNSGRQIIFVSTGERVAKELLGKFYDEFNTIPSTLKPELHPNSVQVAGFPNRVMVFSLPSHNPGNIRGFGMRGTATDVYVDEFAHVSNDHELWIVVRDFQRLGGKITLVSTPKGKRGKFYDIAEPLQALHREGKPMGGEWSYHEISFKECPRLAKQEDDLKKDMTEIDFRQEYCDEFIDESISYFPYELIWKAQQIKEFVSSGYKTNNLIQMGVDFGKKVSETIIFIVEEISPEKFKTIWIEVLPGVNFPDQVEVIKQLAKIFNPSVINIDGTGPGGKVLTDYLDQEESLKGKIFSYDLMSTFKEKIIIRTRILMERGGLLLPTKECTLGEKVESQFHSIQRTTTVTGEHTRYSGKESGMDDIVWAAALSVYKESMVTFEPFFEQQRDSFLEKIAKEQEKSAPWVAVRSWEV